MKDNLENFIEKNREAFDDAIPNAQLWEGIEKAIDEKSTAKVIAMPARKNKWQYLIIAASVVILLGIGVLIGRQTVSGVPQGLASNEELMTEIADLRQYYEKEIHTKQVKLARYKESQTVFSDIAEIDENIAELLIELNNIPKGEEEHIIGLMIEHYRTKVAILERVLDNLEQKKDKKDNENQINI